MDENVTVYQTKIKTLLEKFLSSKCEIKSGCHLDRFLKHLVKGRDSEDKSGLIDLPVFTEWLLQAVCFWHLQKITPNPQISSFTLNLASVLAKDENIFCSLNINNFFVKLVKVTKSRQADVHPSVKLAYIKLISSFLEHKSGIEFMVASNFWEEILNLSLTSTNLVIVKDGRKFMAKILVKVLDVDEDFCVNVVKKIMLPLEQNTLKVLNHFDCLVTDDYFFEQIKPTLQLLGSILEYIMENSFDVNQDLGGVSLFLRNFTLEEQMQYILPFAQNKCVIFDVGKIILSMQFLELHHNLTCGIFDASDVKKAVDKIAYIFDSNISKRDFDTTMKFCFFGIFYWYLFCKNVSNEILENTPTNLINKLFLIQLVPICLLSLKYCFDLQMHEVYEDDIRDVFYQKMLKIADQNTFRLIYVFKDILCDDPNQFEITAKSLVYILRSRKYLLSREKAIMVLQSLIYFFKDFVLAIKEKPQRLEIFIKKHDFMELYLETLTVFIDENEVTWCDSVEAIDMLDLCFDFLSIPEWPPVLIVKALKLLNISFVNYMSPNLALLVDSIRDSTIACLGPLLYLKMLDETCEVQRAALEVSKTMSNLSNSKFPSLQKVLMDSDLPGLVVKMAIGDGESFVRATAIKCLQEMIQVEEIWNNSLKSQDLSGKMRQILINETEGIVRVEAATFMCISYENNQFPEETLERVYETMIHSSTTDLHWEVKVRALNFWDKVINNHLQHQGMIDGSFPSVTFSKEHRKIVTLTDAEIKKRLLKVLGQLSSIGCLGVLISAIRDDCDMEVSKTAVKITQKLVELLKKYNIHGDCSVPTSPQPTENGMSSSASISSGVSGDDCMSSPVTPANSDLNEEIINQIVNSRDVNLLQNVYTPSDYGSVLNYDLQVRTIVSPNEFLLFTQQDLNVIINEKKNWLNGIEDLGSLLDDMLKSYDDDVNSMDCY